MNTFVLHGPHDLRDETRPEPKPGAADVLIDIRRAGICGSDVHYYEHFQIGQFIPQAPLILGHEFAGVVTEVGSTVTTVELGDRVTVEPSIECGNCAQCRAGRYNLCTNLRFIGTAATIPHIDGGFAERVVVPASHCYRIPDALDFGAGALVEPMAVGAQAVRRAGPVAGARVLITGGGTIGQMVLAMVHAQGATDITMADPADYAQTFAMQHGATATVDPTKDGIAQELFADGGYDLVFEASGAPAALSFAYETAARGARVVQIGTQPASVTLPANLVMSKELTVFGSFRYAHVYPTVLAMMSSGRVDVGDMISAVYPFSEMQTAMERAVAKERVVKVQVERS
ncbi:MAG: NAD(P)-dependent alcohol dehydrogenase [Spirochaeta sp.]|jgi:2-desacetyl-2-hydroxyethyl bacteriochlorophyllide A dehydrogenase|nr:NAD(P)-dependent alcohol dehydrogenase [Spirochaeta sp.]